MGGGTEPLMVNSISDGQGSLILDKTFGEIRNAFMNGTPIVVCRDGSVTGYSSIYCKEVTVVGYDIYEGSSAQGTVVVGSDYYSADAPTATLEALDAEYPYMTS